ncbi:hypothetical protein Dda_3432 [Drechslerella dactyloides]|uniref:Protein kinase domain-containing protein n=1 Tax=Drechslerella dactyloides TaxID=74499 RepID=A0AAD6J3M7_DREDA|nr:hypothetical protein Dda_3432 [Drechslerella dactyloides]
MALDYRNDLLYEKSLATPGEAAVDSRRLSRLELWFSLLSSSATPQHIYVDVHRDDTTDATSHSNRILDRFTAAEHECIKELTPLLASHLSSLAASSRLASRRRFGISLKGDTFSDPHTPPVISHTAIISDPQLPTIPFASIKFLEAREIRPNIRITKNPTPSSAEHHDTKCVYKGVDFGVDALNLTVEIANYKKLLAKGDDVEKWLVKLVGLVYVKDVEEPGDDSRDPKTDAGENPQDDGENIQFVGALIVYYPQRDLTTHCYNTPIPDEIKTCWVRQLVCAIAALEEAGFEHWDLKCENIVLDTSDGLPDDEFTDHMAGPSSSDTDAPQRTPERDRVQRRSSTTTKPSLLNPGKLKIIDLENTKSSVAFKPPTADHHSSFIVPGEQTQTDHLPHELGICMVYALGKTILEIYAGSLPSVGNPTEDELSLLPDHARAVVKACCSDPTRISAVGARHLLEGFFSKDKDDTDGVRNMIQRLQIN